MSNSKLQRLIFFSILVFFLAISLFANISFLVEPEKAEKLKNLLREKADYSIQKKAKDENPAIYEYFAAINFKNATNRIDSLRSWVHNNCSNQPTQLYSYTFNTSKVIEDMFLYSNKKLNKKPGLTSYPTILVMQRLCQYFKYKTRIMSAMFFENNSKIVSSYVYLEVFNPDNGNWEIHDPVNDVYFKNKSNHQRLNTFNLKYLLPDSAIVITKDGEAFPDTSISKIFGLEKGKFELIVLTEENKKSTAILNSKYFDRNALYQFDINDKRKFLEIVNYCNPIITY